MPGQNDELVKIVTKFAESGWELMDAPAKAWLNVKEDTDELTIATTKLIAAVQRADEECGNCGCEFDPLYKRALELLNI